jgi:hypothetical protein
VSRERGGQHRAQLDDPATAESRTVHGNGSDFIENAFYIIPVQSGTQPEGGVSVGRH